MTTEVANVLAGVVIGAPIWIGVSVIGAGELFKLLRFRDQEITRLNHALAEACVFAEIRYSKECGEISSAERLDFAGRYQALTEWLAVLEEAKE